MSEETSVATTEPASIAATAAPAPSEGNTNPAAAAPTGQPAAAPGEKPADASTAEKPAEKAGAPEKYADFKLPEGVQLDEQALAQFTPVAKALNLSQDQAQQLIDLQTNLLAKQQEAMQASMTKELQDWKSAVTNDKEIGGPNLQATIANCGKAIDKFGGKDLREALDYTGAGNHPAVVKFIAAVGKAISEDKLHVGTVSPGSDTDLAKRLFPNMK